MKKRKRSEETTKREADEIKMKSRRREKSIERK